MDSLLATQKGLCTCLKNFDRFNKISGLMYLDSCDRDILEEIRNTRNPCLKLTEC